jgi:hypothetical protein
MLHRMCNPRFTHLLILLLLLGCTTETNTHSAASASDVVAAKAFWQGTPSDSIPEDTKNCLDIHTRQMQHVYSNVIKPAETNDELKERYRVLARIIAMEPACKSKYASEQLTPDEIMDRKIADEATLPPAEKARINNDYSLAMKEREGINVQPDASVKNTAFVKEMVECTFPEKTYLYSTLYNNEIVESQARQVENPGNIDSNLTAEYALTSPQQLFGFETRSIYTSLAVANKFWGIQLNKDTDIAQLAEKLGLTKRNLNKQETAGSEAISEGLNRDVPGINELYLYSKPINDGWGEIQLTRMRSDNLFYNPTPAGSADIWYLGCATQVPGTPIDNAQQKAITKSVKDSVNILDDYFNKDQAK